MINADDTTDPDADTKPLSLRAGEAVELNNRIDRAELRLEERDKALAEARANFYDTRWDPLERQVREISEKASGRALVALTLAIVAISVALLTVVLVVLLHALR